MNSLLSVLNLLRRCARTVIALEMPGAWFRLTIFIPWQHEIQVIYLLETEMCQSLLFKAVVKVTEVIVFTMHNYFCFFLHEIPLNSKSQFMKIT